MKLINRAQKQEDLEIPSQAEALNYNIPGVDENGWTVEASEAGGDEISNLEGALTDLAGTVSSSNADALNHNDPGNGGPGTFGDDIPFSDNTENDDDDFAIRGTAKLVIPASGVYQLGLRGDDGSKLTVVGQEFSEVVATNVDAVIEDGALVADALTGDSNSAGRASPWMQGPTTWSSSASNVVVALTLKSSVQAKALLARPC